MSSLPCAKFLKIASTYLCGNVLGSLATSTLHWEEPQQLRKILQWNAWTSGIDTGRELMDITMMSSLLDKTKYHCQKQAAPQWGLKRWVCDIRKLKTILKAKAWRCPLNIIFDKWSSIRFWLNWPKNIYQNLAVSTYI